MVQELERKRQGATFPESAPAENPVLFRTCSRRTEAGLRESFDQLKQENGELKKENQELKEENHQLKWENSELEDKVTELQCLSNIYSQDGDANCNWIDK